MCSEKPFLNEPGASPVHPPARPRSPPRRASLTAPGWSLGTEVEILSAFTDLGLTAVKRLWLSGCSYGLVIYHICTERMIRKRILGQKEGF